MENNRNVRNVLLDAHPHDLSVVVRYQLDSADPDERARPHQKIINLSELSSDVDISYLATVVMEKCSLIPRSSAADLEQILFYLQKRGNSRSQSASSTSDNGISGPVAVKASMDKLHEYIELLYEESSDKNRGALSVLELVKIPSNVRILAENEILISALSRVVRDEWRKNLELARIIISIFLQFSSYTQTQHIVVEQKFGAFCLNTIELELPRGTSWVAEMKTADDKNLKKCQVGLRKEHAMLAACVSLLLNVAEDVGMEVKMLRRGLIPLLAKCLSHASQPTHSSTLLLPVVQFLLKLSAMVENRAPLEKEGVHLKIAALFPVGDSLVRRSSLAILYNLALSPSTRDALIKAGIVQHVAPLIQADEKALNLFYLLTHSDDAKALLPFTDSVQMLMVDVLSSSPSTVSKAALLNACLDRRSAQLAASPTGEGLEALLHLALDSDLLAAKLVRNMATHDGAIQDTLAGWLPRLLRVAMADGFSVEEAAGARALEALAIVVLARGVDWVALNRELGLVQWLQTSLQQAHPRPEHEPFILQQVMLASRMAATSDGAQLLRPLLSAFCNLIATLQSDDECVSQVIFLFVCLLRHSSMAVAVMEEENAAFPNYIIELIHDQNSSVRKMANEAMERMGEMSDEWAEKFRTEKFRYYNAQWLDMVGKEVTEDDDDLGLDVDDGQLYFDDGYILEADDDPLYY